MQFSQESDADFLLNKRRRLWRLYKMSNALNSHKMSNILKNTQIIHDYR